MQSSRSSNGTVIVNPSATQDVMTEVLKGTINIPPTVVKRQGDRIQVLVARDLDFRSVYELKSAQPATNAAAEVSALALTLRALRPFLGGDVMELCINRPHEAFLETRSGWRRERLPFADFDWCHRLAKLIANSTQQRIDSVSPLLSASLPTGERVQIVMPPATSAGCIAIAIRRPAIGSLEHRGTGAAAVFFGVRNRPTASSTRPSRNCCACWPASDFEAFMRLAVRSRKNIVVSGPTGSGKTTWTKALIREIPER